MQDKGGGTKTKPSNFPQLRSRCDTRKANVLFIVQSLNLVWLFAIPWTAAHSAKWRFPSPLLSPRVCSNSCPLSWWCHPATSFSASPFSSCPQFFPASGSFPMSQLFTSGGQSFGASASVLPMNIQGWFPLGLTGLFSLLSKGLSRVFSSTTIWKYQFFVNEALSFLYGPTLIFPTRLLVFPVVHSFDYMDLCWRSDVSAFHMGNVMKRTNLHW